MKATVAAIIVEQPPPPSLWICKLYVEFYVSLTVHHSIDLFQ